MTYRYYMQQPRPMIASKMVKQLKNMSEEIDNYNFLDSQQLVEFFIKHLH